MANKYITTLLLFVLTVFPAGVTIAFTYFSSAHPVESHELENDAFLNDSENKLEILFFGYVGCHDVCPSTLARISNVLKTSEFKTLPVKTGALFIDINATDRRIPEQYAGSFSENIRAFAPGTEEFRSISKEFVLRIYENRDNSDRISHTDHIFILKKTNKKWSIQRVLKNTIDENKLLKILQLEASAISPE